MDQTTLGQEIDVILRAPVVTIIGASALIAVIWGLVNWASKLRIDALKERLNLANDRLAASNEELDRLRTQLAASSQLVLRAQTKAGSDDVFVAQWESFTRALSRTIDANEATISVSKPYIASGIIRRLRPPSDEVHPGTAEGFVSPREPAKPTDHSG
jgi:hypothetical protein